MGSIAWHRSSRCDGGTCVEVADLQTEIAIRDSKDPDGPILRFTRSEWNAFVEGIGSGEFRFPS
jgi:hypothetical protein